VTSSTVGTSIWVDNPRVTQTAGRTNAPPEELAALEEERAFADRSSVRKLQIEGDDARSWLNDLLTAGLAELAEGHARRSLLLSPTGHIRADVHVVATADGFLLLQDPEQPRAIGELLAPYVLSSAVTLTDRTAELSLYAVPGAAAERLGVAGSRPSVLGDGQDLLTTPDDAARIESILTNQQLTQVGEEALEVWRIRRGVARFPVDISGESVPAEAGLDALIDAAKGCFLGQESVAKIRNLGHPARVVRALRSETEVLAGAEVLAEGVAVGRITSAAPAPGGGTASLARVSWAASEARLTTADGAALEEHGPSA
jgi:folate-binding protein YgfZ